MPKASPIDWDWPSVPRTFTLHDKYVNDSFRVMLGEPMWMISVQGIVRKFYFAPEEVGLFQQKLVLLTQAEFSPSSFYKFTFTLLRHWDLYVKLLRTAPEETRAFWELNVLTIDQAKAGKSILKLAAKHSLGSWDACHKQFIRKLNTRANSTIAAQKQALVRRSKLIPPQGQADIVRLLDEKANVHDLLNWQIEGLAVLALGFQHGVRPAQILTLMTNDVLLLDESLDQLTCIISFHEAKKKNGEEVKEMPRQVKPEWAPLIIKLVNDAVSAGRGRIFTATSSKTLWKNTKKVCKQFGVQIDYNYYHLRHTAAQTLADAGHTRTNINNFLGHSTLSSGDTYIKSSRKQASFLNTALGASKLYSKINSIASGRFISIKELEEAQEEKQIGGVVGDKLIAGIGICTSGQGNCVYDPVVSCYNCKKYLPVLDSRVHLEAIAGMRQQVLFFHKAGGTKGGPGHLQLSTAIAGAQRALAISQREGPFE